MMEYRILKLGSVIKDIASGPFGSNLKVDCFVADGFPIIDGANLTEVRLSDNITKFVTEEKARSLSRSIAKKHDVVVTISGTLGQISYIPWNSKYDEYLCSQRQFRVTFDEDLIDIEYLVYYLHTNYGQKKILSFANYVGVPALAQPIPNFKNIEVDVPNLDYQHRVAHLLNSLNDKISLNTCMNAELEAMAKQLYDYWFVQFDFPDENGRPYKSSGGKMVYNEKLKREIPAGWKVRFLGDALSFSNGINYEKGISGDKEYKIINVRNISSSSIFINKNELDVISLPSKQADSFLLNDDDIIIARSGTPGSTRLISDAHNIIYCGFIIKGKLFDSLYKYYILFLLKQLEGTQATKTGGSILQNVSQDTLKSLKLISPSKFILNLFNTRIQSFFSLLNKNQNEINHLTHLRDSLLPMLMNGQVSVE